MEQLELNASGPDGSKSIAERFDLLVTLDVGKGGFFFEWIKEGSAELVARAKLAPNGTETFFNLLGLDLILEAGGATETDGCGTHGSSVRALINRLRKRFPVDERVRVTVIPDADLGPAKAATAYPVQPRCTDSIWKWLGREVSEFAHIVERLAETSRVEPPNRGRAAAVTMAHLWLHLPLPSRTPPASSPVDADAGFGLRVTLHMVKGFIQLDWSDPQNHQPAATGLIRCSGSNQLTWTLEAAGPPESTVSASHPDSIHAQLESWRKRFPVNSALFSACSVKSPPRGSVPIEIEEPPFIDSESPWEWLEEMIEEMAEALGEDFSLPDPFATEIDSFVDYDQVRYARRLERKQVKLAAEEARRQETIARLAAERLRREQQAARERRQPEAKKADTQAKLKAEIPTLKPAIKERAPLPPVPVQVEMPPLEFQETTFALSDLRGYFLRERAALWWVSNQSDDLLCLPHCRIKHLEYQVRTALRVLGPLRGRVLLSDEVGLGKTIEAGLVLKELLTRGMVKRFLVLTVPSLVDQWEEELSDKFGLTTVTTNHAAARDDLQKFWRENPGIVASLHTLKQPAQVEIARQVHWDILIVDEAHYLRNRESQSWQAINVLPRQFMLLLTATPVQNSLEELYNLVTLLQPGQLPSPKEFRARFMDPKRPRQPREPEELRRLLGQVMIRNTRANAGIQLPPRRAETVLFEPLNGERAFWQQWDSEFRTRLAELAPSQASLWGRLLLQAAGSSPAAWRDALQKFPDRAAARAWREQAPLEESWQKKCDLLPPLTRVEGGLVIFTQFLQTQAALAESLRQAGVEAFVINGATPPSDRHPITEEFHRRGGALILTHSGTEGRNLQFSHRLANFDLPWNPMEIEQRIGRLHRLGQQHPVRIYNFVQAGTLQEHLLQILQEKLNLFELVVGETGLILGDRFSSDEFAEEVLRRWRESDGRVAEAMAGLGEDLATARGGYNEVKKLDETLFQKDYESL